MEKENSKFTLGFDNLKYIQFDKYDKDFTFIVNDKKYQTSRFLADLLSPIVNKYHYNDETTSEMKINVNLDLNKEKEERDFFSDFLNLGTFDEQDIDEEHLKHYFEYFRQLGNIKEYLRLQQQYFDNRSKENIISKIKLITGQIKEIEDNKTIVNLICYASSNFEQISKEDMKTLDIDILEAIISNDKLELHDEDSLLKFILELYEQDSKYSTLFEYVIFKNVSENMLEKFLENFDVEHINYKIWQKIIERLISSKNTNKYSKRYNKNEQNKNLVENDEDEDGNIIQIEHKEGDEFNGIMQYLTNKTGGNIHDNGTVDISSRSTLGNRHPKNLVDYNESNFYHSKHHDPNVCVCFDFKERRVKLSSYSIKSYSNAPFKYHLKNWNIEASNDGSNWTIIDEHKNDFSLNGNSIIVTFNIQKETKFYRFIRIHQTGTNTSNDYCMLFYSLEFYGKIKE